MQKLSCSSESSTTCSSRRGAPGSVCWLRTSLAVSGELPAARVAFLPSEKSDDSQSILVVVAFLEAHPQRLHEDFVRLALEAFQQAWPCKDSRCMCRAALRYSVSLASSRAGSSFQDAKIPPDMAIPHYAAIFFAGSRSASRVGRLRNDLDPRIRQLRAPIRGIETSARYGRGES